MNSEFFAPYVFCCKKIPKTVAEVQTLWQHLKDVLALAENEYQKLWNLGTVNWLCAKNEVVHSMWCILTIMK